MKARIRNGRGRRLGIFSRFRPGRWYPAQPVPGEPDAILLFDRGKSAALPMRDVEVRPVPDDAWLVRSPSRLTDVLEGQAIEYPGRIAECPEGHERRIPSRFDADVVELRCVACRRSYRLEDGA